MKNTRFPIQFKYPQSNKVFTTTVQKLYHEDTMEQRAKLIQNAKKNQCLITCHCQKKNPVPMTTSHKKENFFLQNFPNKGHHHHPDCPFYNPASEEQAFWSGTNKTIVLPFSLEVTHYTPRGSSKTPQGSKSGFEPTFKQFCKQLLARTQSHFLYDALKKEKTLLPSASNLNFFLKTKLSEFKSREEIPLTSFYLETPTKERILEMKKELEKIHVLNWNQCRFFITIPVTDLELFEFKNETYTLLTVQDVLTKKNHSLAFKGDFSKKLPRNLISLLKKQSPFAQFWLMGWLPVSQKELPKFKDEEVLLLSNSSHLFCLAINGCVAYTYDELVTFNEFAKANQPLKSCFYSDPY